MNPSDHRHLLDAYAGAWNTVLPGARLRLLERACQRDVAFEDPFIYGVGIAALAAHIGRVRRDWPDSRWLPRGEPVLHGRRWLLRWTWQRARRADAEGWSCLERHADGLLLRVNSGFVGVRTPGAQPTAERPL